MATLLCANIRTAATVQSSTLYDILNMKKFRFVTDLLCVFAAGLFILCRFGLSFSPLKSFFRNFPTVSIVLGMK